jgi:hypothetical protein
MCASNSLSTELISFLIIGAHHEPALQATTFPFGVITHDFARFIAVYFPCSYPVAPIRVRRQDSGT